MRFLLIIFLNCFVFLLYYLPKIIGPLLNSNLNAVNDIRYYASAISVIVTLNIALCLKLDRKGKLILQGNRKGCYDSLGIKIRGLKLCALNDDCELQTLVFVGFPDKMIDPDPDLRLSLESLIIPKGTQSPSFDIRIRFNKTDPKGQLKIKWKYNTSSKHNIKGSAKINIGD